MFISHRKAVKKVYIEKFKYEDIFNFIVPEIAQLISLKHDNLIRYYEHFAKHEFLYLIIEYCEVIDNFVSFILLSSDEYLGRKSRNISGK